MTEKAYIQLTDCDHGPKLTVDLKEAQSILASMIEVMEENGDEQEYTFKVVSMTEEDFKNLPYFEGF